MERRTRRNEQVQDRHEHSEAKYDHEEDRRASVEKSEDEGTLHGQPFALIL
jgi:hypothetical protein